MAVDRLTVKTSFSLGPSRDDDVPFAGGGDDGGDDDGLNCWVSGKRPASRVVPSSIPTQSCQPDSFPLTSQTEPDQSKDSPVVDKSCWYPLVPMLAYLPARFPPVPRRMLFPPSRL